MSLFLSSFFFLLTAAQANTQILQEGGYKILSEQNKTIGFLVQRYEFDNEAEKFKHIYYSQRTTANGDIKESLVAEAAQNLRPIRYTFTTYSDSHAKTVEAQFTEQVMTATITEGEKKTSLQKRISEGTFLSSFLIYLIVQNKLAVNSNYQYVAILEREASLLTGKATVPEETTLNGLKAFKVINTVEESNDVQYITSSGILLKREGANLTLERAQNIIDIMTPMNPPLHQLNMLFSGKLPEGANILDSPVKKNPFLSEQEILRRNKLPYGVSPPPGKELDPPQK